MISQSDLQQFIPQKVIDQPDNFLLSNEFYNNKGEPFLFCDSENLMLDALLNDYQSSYYDENHYLNNSFPQTVLTTQPCLSETSMYNKVSTTSSELLPVVTQDNTDWSNHRFTPHCKLTDIKFPDNIFYSPI
ncbi:uncharacterized protein LOC111088378, partial [Limulus polyphemus]|uniref:Uncharacterized protein LOC111088378 n=1 Tax=Limulus polyphemus TaxID=6850 RepID=A0ABM1TDR4_LIMPO